MSYLNFDYLNLNKYLIDFLPQVFNDPIPENDAGLTKRPEVENLLGIYSSLSNQSLDKTLSEFSGNNFSDFKKNLADILVEKISPISKEIRKIQKDKSFIDNILHNGAQKAEKIAKSKVDEMKKIIGF